MICARLSFAGIWRTTHTGGAALHAPIIHNYTHACQYRDRAKWVKITDMQELLQDRSLPGRAAVRGIIKEYIYHKPPSIDIRKGGGRSGLPRVILGAERQENAPVRHFQRGRAKPMGAEASRRISARCGVWRAASARYELLRSEILPLRFRMTSLSREPVGASAAGETSLAPRERPSPARPLVILSAAKDLCTVRGVASCFHAV